MMTHEELKAAALSNPMTQAAYDDLETEFTLFSEMLKARRNAGLSQGDVAAKMNTKQSSIARIESNGGSKNHSPSLSTLRRYAEAVGCSLEVKLIPNV